MERKSLSSNQLVAEVLCLATWIHWMPQPPIYQMVLKLWVLAYQLALECEKRLKQGSPFLLWTDKQSSHITSFLLLYWKGPALQYRLACVPISTLLLNVLWLVFRTEPVQKRLDVVASTRGSCAGEVIYYLACGIYRGHATTDIQHW